MKKLLTILVVGLVLTGLAGCAQGDRSVTLQFRFEPGLSTKYEQINKRHAQITSGDSIVRKESSTFAMSIEQQVLEVHPDGSATILETDQWDYVHPRTDDSTVMDTVREVRKLEIIVKSDGRIVDLKFLTDTSPGMVKYLKNFYEQGMPIFPRNEVSPGYSWTQTTKVILPEGPMEASTTFKLTSFAREGGYDCAVIECDGNLILPLEADLSDDTPRRGVDRISTTGVTYFAYKEGVVVQQRERWIINGERERFKDGQWEPYELTSETDVDFRLKKLTRK